MEEEEADEKHNEGDDADGEDEVSPSLVNGPVGDEEPGKQGGAELSDGPPNREEGQQGAGGVGQKFEKESPVHGEVAANAETHDGIQHTNSAPA